MQIQVNTDNFINGDERVVQIAEDVVNTDLSYLEDRLTRVEVHLKDQNGDKKGPDNIRCIMEARPKGLDPISAHDDAADIQAALKGAAKKLKGRLSTEFEKLGAHR